jgi:hypothetical protein
LSVLATKLLADENLWGVLRKNLEQWEGYPGRSGTWLFIDQYGSISIFPQ